MRLNVTSHQQHTGRCGPACLRIVAAYFGVAASERAIAKLAGTTIKHGTPLKGMVAAARSLGFDVVVKDNATWAMLRSYTRQGIPVIVDWFSTDEGHYSVVAGIDESTITLQDPELGHERTMRKELFMRVWFDFWPDYLRTKEDVILRRLIAVLPRRRS